MLSSTDRERSSGLFSLPAYLDIPLRRSCSSSASAVHVCIRDLRTWISGAGRKEEKAAYLYHSALCKHIPFHTHGESTDRQIAVSLPYSEEWRGKVMQVFHIQNSLSFMFELYKLNNSFPTVTGPCLQTPESGILSPMCVWTPQRVSKKWESQTCSVFRK